MRSVFAILLIVAAKLQAQQLLPPIGLWREHLSYHSAIDLSAGNGKIYCATPYSLFSVNIADQSLERMSRITGLSQTGINAIDYDAASDKLLVAYSNSDLDLIYRNDIINIPDVLRDDIAGDKTIFNIYYRQSYFYLSTGLGVIVIDASRYEVKETWFIGAGGGQVRVNALANDDSYFYAATAEGLKKAPVNSPGLTDYSNWQLLSGTNGLTTGSCRQVLSIGAKVVVQKNDSLFMQNGNNWTLFFTNGLPIVNCNVSSQRILICQRIPNGSGKVTVLDENGTVTATLEYPALIDVPQKALWINNEVWLADSVSGLIHYTNNAYQQFQPNSPLSFSTGSLSIRNNNVYVAAGGVDSVWNPQSNRNGLYLFNNGTWTNVNKSTNPELDSVPDIVTIIPDPADESYWAGSFGGGLLHKPDNGQSVMIYKQGILGSAVGNPSSFRVAGLAFDKERNLWISNFGASGAIVVRKNDGSWKSFSLPFAVPGNPLGEIVIDVNNYIWILAAGTGNLICFDPGGSIDDTGDDRWKLFGPGPANGNLPSGSVLCMASDRSGFVWVGTTNGIAVLQCPGEVFTGQGCDAVWPIVQQGGYAGYLFSGEAVRSIAVDGADRKWVATKKGVWLISADGEKVVYNFNESNSPLLSDDVNNIAIDGQTGEVFFATSKGICSFRSTATEGTEINHDLLVFPNPVPPGFSGTIAIRGVVNDAVVKITEMDGRLVFQTRALGGQAVWDGRDYRGNHVASGIYLVLVSNDDRTERVAAKIVFIQK